MKPIKRKVVKAIIQTVLGYVKNIFVIIVKTFIYSLTTTVIVSVMYQNGWWVHGLGQGKVDEQGFWALVWIFYPIYLGSLLMVSYLMGKPQKIIFWKREKIYHALLAHPCELDFQLLSQKEQDFAISLIQEHQVSEEHFTEEQKKFLEWRMYE
ncbi:hypothetical protein [Anaeromicropila populeti]|uniref:Uncharacterized protein n=1 Tax=Anaeromicropila populeti TaxID=37658 RepID=A0A1I6JEI2_9FIRM|nr:hypothetical protein [Anaeromicropila populeti]SFR77443.1 hypothetical protein SAMN05661086_01620 [Anaeromicropila populeti]